MFTDRNWLTYLVLAKGAEMELGLGGGDEGGLL